jgi:hypothetical protein
MLTRSGGWSKRDSRNYKGIKVSVRPAELRQLFMRDKAYLMKRPSVDRIDPDGHYVYENIRWVELDLNRSRRYMNARKEKYSEGKAVVEGWLRTTGWGKTLQTSFLVALTKEYRGY